MKQEEEENIRFVAKYYQKGKMNTSQVWKDLNIARPESNRRSLLFRRIASAVAMICLVAGISYWLMNPSQEDWVTIAAAKVNKEVVLPDSTYITLAPGASLRYDRLAYGKTERDVTLKGKAFFAVKHLVDNPFRVETVLADVRVLGTRFQVQAFVDSTMVTVESGKVRFSDKASDEAVLTKGMQASLCKGGSISVFSSTEPNVLAWKTYLFVYRDAPLATIVKELEEVYKVHISGVPSGELRLTTSFDNMPVNDIIEVINQTLDINLTTRP